MKRIILILLTLSMLFCLTSCGKKAELSPKAAMAKKLGIDETVIDEHHQNDPQIKSNATLESAFDVDSLLIIVYSFANSYNYTQFDFEEIDCIKVRTLSEGQTHTRSQVKLSRSSWIAKQRKRFWM